MANDSAHTPTRLKPGRLSVVRPDVFLRWRELQPSTPGASSLPRLRRPLPGHVMRVVVGVNGICG